MTLTPQFLTVGSIVEYNGRPIAIQTSDIIKCESNTALFNVYYKPIPLTPEILTEWCNWKTVAGVTSFSNGYYEVYMENGRMYLDVEGQALTLDMLFLHELQLLFLGFKTLLPITLCKLNCLMEVQ